MLFKTIELLLGKLLVYVAYECHSRPQTCCSRRPKCCSRIQNCCTNPQTTILTHRVSVKNPWNCCSLYDFSRYINMLSLVVFSLPDTA